MVSDNVLTFHVVFHIWPPLGQFETRVVRAYGEDFHAEPHSRTAIDYLAPLTGMVNPEVSISISIVVLITSSCLI